MEDCLEATGFLGIEKLDAVRTSKVSDFDFSVACAGRCISGIAGISSSSSESSLNLGSLGNSLPGM